MEITPIGWILIFLGALFFLTRPNLLYWCAIFFLPFSATAIVNVGSNDSYSGLQAWMFFGALWISREATREFRTKYGWYRGQMRASVRKLVVFLLVALCSLFMPLWINGRLWIQSATLLSNDAHPLFFNMRHVTQFLYLAFGVLFAILVGVKNLDFAQFRRTVRIFLISSIFVCSWGFLQWSCYEFGLSYPAFVFNTNKNESAMGYLAESSFSDLGIARISSVATEPSLLAQYLLIVLVFALFSVIGRQAIISTFWDRSTLMIATLMLLLTTSSTAYLGLALLVPLCLLTFSTLGKIRRRHIVFSVVALSVAFGVLYARSTIVQDLLDVAILSKADSYSGLERLNSAVIAWGYFVQYPVLGVGWGSVTSHDLIVKLLANAGIAGLIAFALFLKSLGYGLWRSVVGIRNAPDAPAREYWACCLLIATIMLIFTNILTEFAVVYGHLWFVFGLALAIPLDRSLKTRASPAHLQQVRA